MEPRYKEYKGKRYISARLVAKITGICYGTVLRDIAKGDLPSSCLGNEKGRNYVDIDDVQDYADHSYYAKRRLMYPPSEVSNAIQFFVYRRL